MEEVRLLWVCSGSHDDDDDGAGPVRRGKDMEQYIYLWF